MSLSPRLSRLTMPLVETLRATSSEPPPRARFPPPAQQLSSGHANRVWDTTGSGSIKLEAKPIARINDIAFDGEGKRIVVVGEGRSAWGASFSLDTGSSIGEISGHSKVVNAAAMRPIRPFKAV